MLNHHDDAISYALIILVINIDVKIERKKGLERDAQENSI